MKLTSKGRYGLKAAAYMAAHYGEGAKPLGEIAGAIDVSDKYLEQILALLRCADVVSTVRGAGGGYMLSRAPSEISVGETLRALEDGLVIVECVSDDGACSSSDGCPTHEVWNKLYKAINDCLDSMSLADVGER